MTTGIAAVGDEGGHAADGVRAVAVADADHALGVGAHEGHGHGDLAAVGQDEAGQDAEFLDDAEDIVPAPGVEAGGVLAQLEEDLFHLHGAEDRLDQHRGANRAARDAQRVLGVIEDIVPEAGFVVAFELGQIEVGAAAARQQFAHVAEEVEAKVEEAGADRLAVDGDVALDEVPAARAHQQRGNRIVEPVDAAVGVGELDGAADGVRAVDLALDDILPGRRERVLEVGHEDLGPRIEGVDHHLALGGAGDLDAAVVEVGGGRGHLPRGVANILGFGQEGRQLAAVDLFLALGAAGQELLAARVEAAVQVGDEGQGVGRQNFAHRRA